MFTSLQKLKPESEKEITRVEKERKEERSEKWRNAEGDGFILERALRPPGFPLELSVYSDPPGMSKLGSQSTGGAADRGTRGGRGAWWRRLEWGRHPAWGRVKCSPFHR